MAENWRKSTDRFGQRALRSNVPFSGPIDPPIRNRPVWQFKYTQKKLFPEQLNTPATVELTARLRPFSHHYAASQAGVSFELRRGRRCRPCSGGSRCPIVHGRSPQNGRSRTLRSHATAANLRGADAAALLGRIAVPTVTGNTRSRRVANEFYAFGMGRR